MKFNQKSKNIILISILAITIGYVVFGGKYFNDRIKLSNPPNYEYNVVEIVEIKDTTFDSTMGWYTTNIEAKVIKGKNKGSIVSAELVVDELHKNTTRAVEIKDKYIAYPQDMDGELIYGLGESVKSNKIILLVFIFFAGLLILGGKNGIFTISSLTLTCLSVFCVFIPSVLSGHNIYINSVIASVVIIISTIAITLGINKKALCSAAGCVGGVLVAGLTTVIMTSFLNISGMINQEAVYLTYISDNLTIDLKGVIFASIIIGALGATMDVSISIASAMREIRMESPEITFQRLLQSGLRIGKDIMGTMTNTLILAYVGSSLSVIILLIANNSSVFEILNREMIVVELLQAVSGSLGMLLTIPITAFLTSYIYTKKNRVKI